MVLYHYTKSLHLPSILRHDALWPSPPLRVYGLSREEVERDPARFGFREGRRHGRRCFSNPSVPHPDHPGMLSAADWFEGQVFDVALTRADWCYSVLSYFPQDLQEGGDFWRLVVETDGPDLAGWQSYQQCRRTRRVPPRSGRGQPQNRRRPERLVLLLRRAVSRRPPRRTRAVPPRALDAAVRGVRAGPLVEMPRCRRQFEADFAGVGARRG